MDLKDYWNKRIQSNKRYTSIGDISQPEAVNKYRKESLFKTIDENLIDLGFNLDGKSVLDAGCGTGIYSEFYAKKGARVSGIDFSSTAIQSVRKKKIPGVFYEAGINKIPFGDSCFNLVHCFSVLYHIVDDLEWENALRELCRVTADEGILLLRIEWVNYEFQFNDYQKYRERSRYLKVLNHDKQVSLIKCVDIADVPKYPKLARFFSYLYSRFGNHGLFKIDSQQKLLIFRKHKNENIIYR